MNEVPLWALLGPLGLPLLLLSTAVGRRNKIYTKKVWRSIFGFL